MMNYEKQTKCNSFYLKLAPVLVFILLATQGCATGGFALENDTLAGDVFEQSDRNFTQSTAISYETEHGDTPAGKLLRLFHTKLPFFDQNCSGGILGSTDHIGVTAFTPDDIEQEDPDELSGDRPYASLVAYGATLVRKCGKYVENENEAVDARGLFVALLGLNVARDAQRFLHNDLGVSSQDPRGWNTQISDGGEPTFLYTWERKYLLKSDKRKGSLRRWDLSWTNGVNLGYYTNANFGFDLRFGILASQFWQSGGSRLAIGTEAPAQASGSSSNQNVMQRRCFLLKKTNRDCFGFFGVRVRAVAYNALLTGQFRSSDYELQTEDVKGLVAQATMGVSFDTDWDLFNRTDRTRITLAFHARSPEYDSELGDRTHYWGGFYFSTGLSN